MIPTRQCVGVRSWSASVGVDAHGNPSSGWADPVPVAVHAVAPRVAEEPGDPRRFAVVDGLTVYAPAGTRVAAEDRIVWPVTVDRDGTLDTTEGTEWEVDGPVADWTRGPWVNPVAGVTFDIVQVRG